MTSQPQTVTIAQARASTASGLLVADTAANIVAALPNPALTARVASFNVSAGASLTAAQMSLLFPIAGKLHAAANSLSLTGANVFTAGQMANYESLSGFTVGLAGSINLSDTTAQIVATLANHPAWFSQISAVTVHLDGTSIGAYPASQLSGLATHGKTLVFVTSPGHTVLNVAAAAHDLATNTPSLNALGTHQTLSFTVTNDGAGISATDAASLTALQGFSPAAHTLFVSDTGTNVGAHLTALLGRGFAQIQVASGTLSAAATQLLDPSVHFLSGAHAQLASSATLSAPAAASLVILPGFNSAIGAALTVADTAANLAATSASWLSAASAVSLTADAAIGAGTATTLSQVATTLGGRFSLAGHVMTVSDSLPALIALPVPALALATTLVLNADTTATAAQFTAFQALAHVAFGGHTVAVVDSAINLLGLAGADLSHVSSVSLAADAVVNAAQMQTLAAEPGFSTGGHALIIADTAANLLALPGSIVRLASAVELSADATLNAASAQALTSETGYTTDLHTLTIADSAAVLANLTGPVLAFAASEQVNVSATISAATAAALASLPHLTEAAGVTLAVQDTLANVLAAPAPALAVAASVRLVVGSIVNTDVAHAAALAAIAGFSAGGSTITVSDTLSHLSAANTAGWSSVAATHVVVDSPAALVAGAASPLLASATSVTLTGPASVTASIAATLASLPNFVGAGLLAVADTTSALIAHTSALVGLECPVTVTDSAAVTTAEAASLAQIAGSSGAGFTFGGQFLTIADTAADLLSLTPMQAGLAGSILLAANATLNAAQFATLRGLPHVSLAGHTVTVSDTAANLASLSGDISMIVATNLSTGASVTAAVFVSLTALPSFSAAGNMLVITDTAPALLGISTLNLSQAASATLSTDATVSANQAQTLLTEPAFSTGGHQFVIADTAANILGLPHTLLIAATSLTLAGDQNVSASELTQLASIGIKFTEAGHSLTCVDTAANLAMLSPAALALANAELLNTSSVVNAATAAALASLTAFSPAHGVTIAVQDSAANLIALGHGLPAGTTSEMLTPGSSITINAQQASALASISHFTAMGATITVADSVDNLVSAGSTVLQAIASYVEVTDTAANLAMNASLPIVENASSVILSSNAAVTASVAAQIASIPNFSTGTYQLEVMDTGANIAASAAALARVSTGAVVTDAGPVSTSAADQLATISALGILSFRGGNPLLVQDTYAALIDPSNSAGLVLAGRIGVLDTPTQLVTASAYNWGALNPSYTLSQGGAITAATAMGLAALGSHFSAAGFPVVVADTAAAVVSATIAINALHVTASVADSAANLDSQASGLIGLGTSIIQVRTTDVNPVSATVAAGLSGLAELLTGPALQVSGTAIDVELSLSGLATLASHVAVTVSDSAADIAPFAANLATLGTDLTIVVTDAAPVSAAIAAALLPVVAQLASAPLAVTDTGTGVAAHAGSLATMGSAIGTLTLSDGSTQTVANAAALAVIDAHLGAGVMLTATGSVADVAANRPGLESLDIDHRLESVIIPSASVNDAVSNLALLNTLPTSVTISDNAENVDENLSDLAQINNLQAVALTDNGIPALSMSVSKIASDTDTLAKITTPYTLTITDTAAHIASDLALGTSSVILSHLGQIGEVSASDGQAVTLDQAQMLAGGVNDGPTSALALFSGSVLAVGVDLAHLPQIVTLPHAPTGVAVTDSTVNIEQDLALGSSSAILGNLAVLTGIAAGPGPVISLTAEQATYAGVDDGAHSAIGLIPGAALVVTAASIANLPLLAGLFIAPTSMAISDTAANVSADLGSGNSSLIAAYASLTTISVADGLTISLSEQQLRAAHVDDGADSILSKTVGGHLAVSQVTAADLAIVLGLGVAPTSVSVTDTAAHVLSNLTSVLANLGSVSAVNLLSGTLTLTADEILQSGADDGAGSLIDRIAGHVFNVTGASISQIPALLRLPDAPATMAISDSTSNIVADLISGHSSLASAIALLGTVTVTHGTLTLTDAQATVILGDPSLDAVFAHLTASTIVAVTGVPVSDLAGVAGSGWPHIAIAVADSASNMAADLMSGHSVLLANSLAETSVTLSSGGVVDAASLAAMTSLPNFQTASFNLAVQDTASNVISLPAAALSFVQNVSVVDSSAIVGANLDLLQSKFDGHLTVSLTDTLPALSVTASQYSSDRLTIDAVTSSGVFTVSGSATALAALAGTLGSDPAVNIVSVTDSAFDVVSNLAALSAAGSKLHVSLSDTSIAANLVTPLLGIANLSPAGLPVSDTGTQIAAIIESGDASALTYLNTYGASLSSNSAVSATDAAALESLGSFSKAGHTLVVWDTAQHLTVPAYAGILANPVVDGVNLKSVGGPITVTAAQAAALFAIPGFSTTNPSGTANTVVVSDTAARIEASLSALTSNAGEVAGIVVNSSATISDQTLSDLQSLGATAAAGVSMTIRDTGSIIASSAATQLTNHSILPAFWTLSGNGTLSEADAIVLGGLPHFSPGLYTLTVALTANAPIAIPDANKLGTLAGALNLSGYHLVASGSAAQLSTLSSGALLVVTPALTDTAASIAALSATSPLLLGSVEVTGSDVLSASTVAGLLSLVNIGVGTGISGGALTFDSTHAVDDTIASLRSLTSGTGWTSNPSAHSAFHLVAQDTVANLVNPANTTLLAGLTGSTLSGDVTINAATANALASLSNAIHFDRGISHITVQDSAADLLDVSNAPGIALANSVQLAGPDQVDATDAETLLNIAHFHLSTTLVVSDSSANLLDGVLGSTIASSGSGSHIIVQLAGPETLDAQTAEGLVSLPGFADAHNLSIADDPSYLLDNTNLAAEQMAVRVTLAGDEVVSANTVFRLSQVPHFSAGDSHLLLSSNDFADAATLKAVADVGGGFQANGHSLTMTADALDLSSTEYTALQSDNVLQNGHLVGVLPSMVAITEDDNVLQINGHAVASGIVKLYSADGSLVSSNTQSGANFVVSVSDSGHGQNFSLTESAGGNTSEGAPLVVLDTGLLEHAVAAAGGTFASTGQFQVDTGKFINLYQAGSVPQPLVQAALVYDPASHTVSLDVPGQASVTLVTLGGSTHPSSLDASEILFKLHG